MGYARFETATLGEVDETYYFGAHCQKCQHGSRISLERLRDHLGADFPLLNIRARLRCDRCESRGTAIVTFLTPAHRTGNLLQLFRRKIRSV